MIRRREFLRGVSGVGTAALFGLRAAPADAQVPPETKKLALALTSSICQAPQYVAETLLKAEGFTDIRYVPSAPRTDAHSLSTGAVDITVTFAAPVLLRVDADEPVVLLGGGHVGCQELVANERVRSVRDLKGKTVLVYAIGGPQHIFLAMAMAHVGLDPRKDSTMVVRPPADALRMFEEGKVDAVVVSPPVAQEFRAKKIGRVIVDTAKDRPWAQYFCCMVVGNREFVRKHPVATKRAMRALLKSTDVCALEPEGAARMLVDKGFADRYDYAFQTMKELPYAKWREYDPEDAVRFYALRLHEAGMIKSSPQKIISQGTDWRFLNELKKELKG